MTKNEETNTSQLRMFGLPILRTMDDFSSYTHLSKYTLYQLSTFSDKYYRCFSIPKRAGGIRVISHPSWKLKGLQSWILVNILNKLSASDSCKGFEKGTSIADNAEPHIYGNAVMTIDLQDFFSTIKSNQVTNLFRSMGYGRTISVVLTNLCTFNGFLPQGGPCSPKISNLIARKLDRRIQGYVGKRGIAYTRYADDLTFSGRSSSKLSKIKFMVNKIIESEGFMVNPRKTRIAGPSRLRMVTGLVLSDDSFGIGQRRYKEVRAKIHNFKFNSPNDQRLKKEIEGWLAYMKSVDKKRFEQANEYLKELDRRISKGLGG